MKKLTMAVVLLTLLVSSCLFAADKKPNVLFIVVDDLRPDLGCYGAAGIHSPNIDKLAARGLLLERAYCQVAVCNPSRCSLLSGTRPDTTGVLDNQHFLRPQMPNVLTLPQHFKNNGWHTASLGKVFHHSEKEPGDDPQSWSEPSWYHGEPYRHWFTKESDELIKRLKGLPDSERPKILRGLPYEAAHEPDDSYPDGQLAAKAIETLRRLKGGEPFFLGVGFFKPHLPFTCPQKYWDLYPADSIKLPDNYFPPKNVPAPALHNWYELRTYGGIPADGGIPDETALNLIRGYRACISFVDVQIGRVLDELDRLGLRDDTIVVLWGDNGYHLGENGIFTKMTNFELGTHVPLIVSVPKQKTAGQKSPALVEFVDIYPTLAELAGLPLPPHLEGKSFVPLLGDPAQPWKQAAFSQYLRTGKEKFMGRSVRTDRWRYTEWTDAKKNIVGRELYDEQTDPRENVNLAGDAANQSTAAELAQRLHDGWNTKLPPSAQQQSAPAPSSETMEAANIVDASSLRGKVLCGYQAWFRCPGDAANMGWVHWSRDGKRIAPQTLTFEMWPDLHDYSAEEKFAAPGFTYPNGTQAELFSSDNARTVLRHFEWMRDYGIDGVWLQHFLVDLPSGPAHARYESRTRVLNLVRDAARQTGRAWALAFDISGMPENRIFDALTTEWKKLVDEKITADPRYVHEGGRPVVEVWGFYHHNTGGESNNAMTVELANQLIDFFKAPGPYGAFLVGGGDWNWRRNPNPEWQKTYRRFDAYSPWNTGNFAKAADGTTRASTGYWAEDKRECEKNGMLWLPVVYPGFSWDNLQKKPAGTTGVSRRGGKFLWEQFHELSKLGVDSACVAMFDEVDEGTAIFKVTNHPPSQAHFVGYEGQPSDWYLRLVGAATKALRDKRPIPPEIPLASDSSGAPSAARPDIALGAFEGKDLSGWTTSGEAFYPAPFQPGSNGRFAEFEGAGIAWSGCGGIQSQGTLLSPKFEIQRPFINFLVAGGRDLPANLGVELLVDDRVVRAASASEAKDPSHALYWRTWEVRDLAGRAARIRVNDRSTTGAIAVDCFAESDQPKGVPVDATVLGQESHRPQFHYTAESGWLNDANGLLCFQGQWHLFHQHRPPNHPTIVWGHATSSDLLHWQRLPPAIQLDGGNSAASGSGLVDWTNASGLQRGEHPPLLLFYTLHPPGGAGDKCTQCLAYSTDAGRTFQQFSGNPLLRTADSFDRDPKVFYHAPSRAWFMALSLSRNNEHRDQATYGIFRSKDLKSWERVQELGPGAWYWECPDLFALPVDGDPAKTKWIFQKGSGDYIVGTFDEAGFKPESEPIRTHWGGNFYGAQTFADAPGGRRVQIAWMSTGKEGPNSWPGMPFNQQMSFPRELTLRTTPDGPRLFREPVAEISQLYAKTHALKPRSLAPGDNALAGISHELLDIELEIELRQATQVILGLRGEEIKYDAKEKKLKAFGRALSLAPVDGKLILRALLDRTSIELFGNRGEVTLSGVFFPAATDRRIALTAQGGSAGVNKLVIRELKSIWPERPANAP